MNIQKSKITTIAEPAKQNQLILVSKLVLDRFGVISLSPEFKPSSSLTGSDMNS